MMMQFIFSTIFWDPNPDIFTIPFLNHPLKWYGLLFMGGIVAGFFIIIPLIKRRLLLSGFMPKRDLASWKEVEKAISEALINPESSLHPLTLNLDKKTQLQIQKNEELSPSSQSNILKELSKYDRLQLETLLPKAIYPLKEISFKYADGLMWWIVFGTIIGARLGHVFFYEWPYYQNNPLSIFKVWEGGLASHGGTLGVLLALYLYSRWTREKFPELNFLTLADLMCIPTAFAAVFIRIGNFVNQEILGTPSNLPWAVVFGHPIDGGPIIPRHPVQLYEAVAYFFTFVLLLTIWKVKKGVWAQGLMIGLLFICIFGSRFLLEFFKAPQASSVMDESFLQMGQLLSVPFILLGIGLLIVSQRRKHYDVNSRQT